LSEPQQTNPPTPSSVSETPEQDARLRHGVTVAAMSLLILVLLYFMLRELSPILRPLFVATFLCYLIVPIHHWLVVRFRVPSIVAYVIIVSALLAGMYTSGQLVYVGAKQFTQELQGNVSKLEVIATDFRDWWSARWDRVAAIFPRSDEAAEGNGTEADQLMTVTSQPVDPLDIAEAVPPARTGWELVTVDQINSWTRSNVTIFLGNFLSFGTGALVVAFYMIFLLIEQAGFPRRLQNAFGPQQAAYAMSVVHKINVAVAKYITVKTFVSALIGMLSGFILLMFNVQYALLWGVLTFFANFVPYIGSLFAVAVPIGLSFIQYHDDPQVPIIIAVLLIVSQQLTGSFLEPRLLGERLGISPIMILLSLAFWGYLWGVPGMILSSPLVVSIKIILENIPQTRPIARLISNVEPDATETG
jgi:predicted PurR-regulated permease PerM